MLESAAKRFDKVLCLCECGKKKRISGDNLVSGNSKSCGCVVAEKARQRMLKHGKSKTPEYFAWVNAKARCHRKTHPRWAEWGGRGIAMCDRWRNSFDAFLADMGPKPAPGYSIERKDNDKGYEPGNCVWATAKEQSSNRPTWTRVIEFGGVTMTLTAWAALVGISRESLRDRIDTGWTIHQALTTPKGGRRAAS